MTKLGDNPSDIVTRILGNYRIHNAEVLFREDCGIDELIDVLEGNRKYIPCLYVYNKIDTLSIEEVDEIARKPDSIVVSVYMNLNLDTMLMKMWEYLGLLRVYTKRRGQPPDLNDPIILSRNRHGITVESVCLQISKEFLPIFNFALVWGRSTKHNPQHVGLAHTLCDEDVVQVVAKTLVQQKHSKEYRQRVDSYNLALAKDRRKRRKPKS